MHDLDLEGYSNKANVWGYDELTHMIQQRVGTMPDLPKRVAILLSWTESDDASIRAQFGSFGAAYEVLALKWLDLPLRLFFFALSPDSAMGGDDFLDALAGTAFAEAFLLRDGRAVTRFSKLESLEEAQRKHSEAIFRLLSPPSRES